MKRIVLCMILAAALLGMSGCSDDRSMPADDKNTAAIFAEGAILRRNISEVRETGLPVSAISINEMSLTLHPGEKCTLRTSVQPENADITGLVWHSSDDSIVTVTDKGELKALTDGTVTVTVTAPNDVTSSCQITVVPGEYIEDSEESKEESKTSRSEHTSAPVITGKAVEASWFDDAVFIGDSVMFGLYNYAENGCLGDADFLAIDCMGYHSAMFSIESEYGIHPVYNGVKVMIDDAVQEIGKKKVFIMLGMNDICSWGVEDSADAMQEFVDQLLAKSPDIQIYVHSVTPMIAAKDGTRPDSLNNANIVLYNEKIKQVCAERGFVYLDLVPVVADSNGCLRDDYCVDPNNLGFHYNSTALQAWVDFLKTHVQ